MEHHDLHKIVVYQALYNILSLEFVIGLNLNS